MRKGSLQESRGGWRAFKVTRLQLEVEQVKNSDPESTLRIHNIAVKLGRKSGMQGGGRRGHLKLQDSTFEVEQLSPPAAWSREKVSTSKPCCFLTFWDPWSENMKFMTNLLAVHMYTLTLLINWFGEVMVKQCWSNVGQMEEKLDFIISRVVRGSPGPLDTAPRCQSSVSHSYNTDKN